MQNPFHLSFVVPDKEKAKAFYTDILECKIGRDTESWFDILFFGHQVTIHQASSAMPAKSIDHFGPILSEKEWREVAQKIEDSSAEFISAPFEKTDENGNKSGKYLVRDPAGNVLEFKYYDSFNETVG